MSKVPEPPSFEVLNEAAKESRPVIEKMDDMTDEAIGQILVVATKQLAKRWGITLTTVASGHLLAMQVADKVWEGEE